MLWPYRAAAPTGGSVPRGVDDDMPETTRRLGRPPALLAALPVALLAACATPPPRAALPPATRVLVAGFTGDWTQTRLSPPSADPAETVAAQLYAESRTVRDGLATAMVDRLRALGYPAVQASPGTLRGHPAPYVPPGAPPALVLEGQVTSLVAPSGPMAPPAARQIVADAQLFRYDAPEHGTLLQAYALHVSGDHEAALVPVSAMQGRLAAERAAAQVAAATPPPDAVSLGSGDTAALRDDATRLGVLLANQAATAMGGQGLRAGPPLPPPAPVLPKDVDSASPPGY